MFTFESDKCYRMPAHFGGWPYRPVETCYHDVTSITFTYTTDGDRLSAYIPEGFELLRPELSIGYSQCREVDWMGGSAYNLIDVSAPVRFNGRRDRVEGAYSLVVWENKTAPILTGREETGVPKIYADIEDLHILGDRRFTVASHEGNTFLRLAMTVTGPMDEAGAALRRNLPVNSLNLRYIPRVGGPGADLIQPILFPQRQEARSAHVGDGAVQWIGLHPEAYPVQAYMVKALAELPMLEAFPAVLTQGAVYLMSPLARVLE